jgi:hypothetical protein
VRANIRGGLVEEFLATNDLVIKNTGKEFTFVNSMHSTIIDITVTNRCLEDNIANWAVNTSESFSDHKRIEFTLEFATTRSIEAQNYSQANWKWFNSILARKFKQPDPNPAWDSPRLDREAEKFEQTLNYALDKTCPKKIIKLGVNKPRSADWFQPETQRLSKLAKNYARTHRANPTPGSKARYIDARRQLQNNIRANQRECRKNFCANITDMKSFSNYTKSLTGTKAPPIGMLEDPATGLETNTVEDVARVLLNQHFPGSVAPNPNPNPANPNLRPPKPPQDIDLEAEDLKFITPNKLIEAFRLFGSHKSPGPDKFKPIILQKLPANALKVLCTLYKVSIALGYSPKRWTESKVIFIPKPNKQNYADPNAFRPISLCSFILKGLERLVLFHLEETNLSRNPLCDAQHAFRRGKGSDTALSEAVDKIESGLLRH